jgi:hypothetical protein
VPGLRRPPRAAGRGPRGRVGDGRRGLQPGVAAAGLRAGRTDRSGQLPAGEATGRIARQVASGDLRAVGRASHARRLQLRPGDDRWGHRR